MPTGEQKDAKNKDLKFKYKRVLLKLSGEALAGERGYGIEPKTLESIAEQIKEVHSKGMEIALVIGGGNIFRGVSDSASAMERAPADYIGMLATVINALSLQNVLEKKGIHTRVMSALTIQEVAEPYIRRKAIRHLEKGRIVIFAGGTGNPYFTTDTAAALRAMEIGADVVLKATKVDGIYTADPIKDSTATKFDKMGYLEIITKGLKVMDITSVSLCMENKLPIVVFNLNKKGNLKRILSGEEIGTLVR